MGTVQLASEAFQDLTVSFSEAYPDLKELLQSRQILPL
jgi:hypothetical protein